MTTDEHSNIFDKPPEPPSAALQQSRKRTLMYTHGDLQRARALVRELEIRLERDAAAWGLGDYLNALEKR